MERVTKTQLIKLAIRNTIELLSHYGNSLNSEHQNDIKKIIIGFVSILESNSKRLAFPLFCGGGKTTCIRGLIKALHDLNLDYGIVISANQVEALCELKLALLRDGVPQNKIGLIHSKENASIASDEKNEASNKQFVLVTHNRIKQNNKLDSYFYYNEKNRDLVIWDESLLFGESIYMKAESIRSLIAITTIAYQHRIKGTDQERNYTTLINYLGELENVIKQAQSEEEKDFRIDLKRPEESTELLSGKIRNLLNNSGEELISLIDYIDREEHVRYIKEQNGSLIYFKKTIPDGLERIAVLDASHMLREITKSDNSIKTINLKCSKSYENLKINYFKHASGRESTEKHGKDSRHSTLLKEMVRIIGDIAINHTDEPILIWTFKQRNEINMIEVIKEMIRTSFPSLDLDKENENGERIFNFQTYGNELGLNSYVHCKHSVFVGLLHLPDASIVTYLKGQSRNMDKDVYKDGLLYKASVSEQAHVLYQAISRGSSRETDNGKCLDHSVYFYHRKPREIKRLLDKLFPGSQWNRYNPNYLDNTISKAYQNALDVDNTLSSLSGEEIESMCGVNNRSKDKVSTKKVKSLLFNHFSSNDWKLITREFNGNGMFHWKIDGRSFVRC